MLTKQEEMKGELEKARVQLEDAMDRYLRVCRKLRDFYFPWATHDKIHDSYSLDYVRSEISLCTLSEADIQAAKHDLTRAQHSILRWGGFDLRNGAYPTPPPKPLINKLPLHVLTRVFQWVLAINPCSPRPPHRTPGSISGCPRYPDYLTQVCTHWRTVALSQPSFWTHIDICPGSDLNRKLISRAHRHAERAGELLLELHIIDSDPTNFCDTSDLYHFLKPVAHRVGVLDFYFGARGRPACEKLVYQVLFRGGTSKNLTKLILTNPGPRILHEPDPLRKEVKNSRGVDTSSNEPWEELEPGFASLTSFHHFGVTFIRSKTAYQGLVDLRLVPRYEVCPVSEARLVEILNQSPRLRILHLALKVDARTALDQPNCRVLLSELEVLNLIYPNMDPQDGVGCILRLISPGCKQLRLTLELDNYDDTASLGVIKDFFSRSRISKFCARGGCPPPNHLLHLASELTDLVFYRCDYNLSAHHYPMNLDHSDAADSVRASTPSLDAWDIQLSSIFLDDFNFIIRGYRTGSLVVSNCGIYRKRGTPGVIPEVELSSMFPNVRFITHEGLPPDPTAHWNKLD